MNKRQQTLNFEDQMVDDGLDEEFNNQFDDLLSQALTQREQAKLVSTGFGGTTSIPNKRNYNEMCKPLSSNIHNIKNVACNSPNQGKFSYGATPDKPSNGNVVGSSQMFSKKRSGWNDTIIPEKRLCPESTVYASQQKKLEDPKVKELNDKIRELKCANAKMEEELKLAQDETRVLKGWKEDYDHLNNVQRKTIQKLESQLAFQKIETNSSQINQVQKSVNVRQNGNVNDISRGFNLANCDTSSKGNNKSNFPTPSSFSKCLPRTINSATSTSSLTRVADEPKSKDFRIKLKMKCKSAEVLLLKSVVRPLESLSINSQFPPLISIPSMECGDSTNILKPTSKINLEAAQLKEAMNKLIESERCITSKELSIYTQVGVWSRFNVEMSYDEIFLRLIEYNLVFPIDEENKTNETIELSINECLQSLHLLKCLVNCSVRLKNYILEEVSYSLPSNNWNNGDLKKVRNDGIPCNILKTLFKFFSPTVQIVIGDNAYLKMMETILEILNELGNNAEAHHMTKFLPLLNPEMIKVCKSHLYYPDIFIGIVRLFATLFTSKEILKATCQEAICLWVVLAPSWVEMASKYSSYNLNKLDQQMCKLLLQSLSIENFKPPFIDTVDCHCSCDVGISLVNFLYRNKLAFEANGKIDNKCVLQHGLEVLYHLSASDPNIDDRVKAKYMSFLRWLNKMYKTENLGHFAEVLLDKYYPNDEHSFS